MTAALVFPHQLFDRHPALRRDCRVLLVEDQLFFGDYYYPAHFHSHKLVFHRASMQSYASRLRRAGHEVTYIDYECGPGMPALARTVEQMDVSRLILCEPEDFVLEKRLRTLCSRLGITLDVLDTPGFLSPAAWVDERLQDKQHYAMTSFYQAQRKRLDILMHDGKPVGGKWTYDIQNRERLPRGMSIPPLPRARQTKAIAEARSYVQAFFPDAPGADARFPYPVTHAAAARWLDDFLEQRLACFGTYEDAIVVDEPFLFHSVLSPLINAGLLAPRQVLDRTIAYADAHPGIGINNLEGFVRQIIGWREFMRGVYRLAGVRERTTNALGNARPMPACFYDGTTGIEPLDTVITRVLKYAYCHHIERLMVLGNFMLLCDIDPTHVYRWFMELFIDAYDWVMVPNVYGMSQYADGGLITTKPYVSSSNYIRKMSNFSRGNWCDVWDGLYWRFIHRHKQLIADNPRMSMMARQVERMAPEQLKRHCDNAERFLATL